MHTLIEQNYRLGFRLRHLFRMAFLFKFQAMLKLDLIQMFCLDRIEVVLFCYERNFYPMNFAFVIEWNCELGSISLDKAINTLREHLFDSHIFQGSLNLRSGKSRFGSDRRNRERRKIKHSTSKKIVFLFLIMYILYSRISFLSSRFQNSLQRFLKSILDIFQHNFKMKKKMSFSH